MENKDCFSTEKFEKVSAYIAYRILNSSAGTNFYLEYPVDKKTVHDGIKRPSNNPESVYDIRFEAETQQIIFKSQVRSFRFHVTEGLLNKETQTKEDNDLANSIFCHLVALECL